METDQKYPVTYNSKIKLGDTVRDIITNFEGIAYGVTFWLYGCARFAVKSKDLHEGKPIEMEWFDEAQLEIVAKTPKYEQPKTGGPQKDPRQAVGR